MVRQAARPLGTPRDHPGVCGLRCQWGLADTECDAGDMLALRTQARVCPQRRKARHGPGGRAGAQDKPPDWLPGPGLPEGKAAIQAFTPQPGSGW